MSKKYILGSIILGILFYYGCGDDVKKSPEPINYKTCISETDCESGVCLNSGYCATVVEGGEACDYMHVCKTGYKCTDGVCTEMDSTDCQDGNCDPSPGDKCKKGSDCASGVCLDNSVCATVVGEDEKCDSTRICLKGYHCVTGVCKVDSTQDENCTTDADCPDGKMCQNGTCTKPGQEEECWSDDYCPEGEVCKEGHCEKPTSPEEILSATACKRQKILSGGTTGNYERFNLAKITNKDYKYYPEANMAQTNVVRFEAPKEKVVGFFGSSNDIVGTGQQLLSNTSLESGTYVENSAFKASVPLASWLVEDKGYDAEKLQLVPNHSVDRYKYSIILGSKTLQDAANAIAKLFEASSTEKYGGKLACADGKATLYLARSVYEMGNVYSGAIACDADMKTPAVLSLMEDIQSGTLVSPTKKIADVAPVTGGHVTANGYDAFEDFVCQIEPYGKSSGKADFLWVIDNSGSMFDEQENLSDTVELFAKSMKAYGIDFRFGVTTTDAYLLDEDPTAYIAYDENYKIVINSDTYLNGLGFRQHDNVLRDFRGFLDILTDSKIHPGKRHAFQYEITTNSKCNANGKKGNNICGFGFEDGLKSGAFTLSRANVNVNEVIAPDYYSDYDKSNWANIKAIKEGVVSDINPERTDAQNEEINQEKREQVSLDTDVNTLLYVIWLTDEESRQFKEEPQVVKPVDFKNTNSAFDHSTGRLCSTGYKQKDGTIKTGPGSDKLKTSDCNPSMKSKLNELIQNGTITEDSTMAEIEVAYPEYANMLKYYIQQYQNFAQDREIVGFAFVGDSGRENGGFCKKLAICKDSDCTKKDTDGSCLECSNWDYNNPAATVGANYGLSYIHMARFLSSYYPVHYPDNWDNVTKEGGKASICATDYSTTMTSIAEDVVGRLGAHPLKGYPISSTIRVYRVKNNKVTELTRNAATDGWSYDASQNAITFKEIQNMAIADEIAITYVIWRSLF